MKGVELYVRVRRAVFIDGMSRRATARLFGVDRRTVGKMLRYSVPPGYQRKKPPARPKLDPFGGFVDRILEEDEQQPRKQRHTSKRIFERLRDEYSFAGGITIVKDCVFAVWQRLTLPGRIVKDSPASGEAVVRRRIPGRNSIRCLPRVR